MAFSVVSDSSIVFLSVLKLRFEDARTVPMAPLCDIPELPLISNWKIVFALTDNVDKYTVLGYFYLKKVVLYEESYNEDFDTCNS